MSNDERHGAIDLGRTILKLLLVEALFAVVPATVRAQAGDPDRAIRAVVPLPPGAAADVNLALVMNRLVLRLIFNR